MSLSGAEDGSGFRRQTAGPVDRATQIHGAILLAVVEQRLPPGTKLPEDQLATHFAVSRTLVRVALQSLAGDGIVVLARNRGAAVASPSPQEARDLFDARRVVEAVTAARAAERVCPDGLAALDRLTAEGRAALAQDDRGKAIRLSGEFHVALARMAKQPVLEAFLAELVARSSLVIALYGHRGRSDCGDHDHLGILAALRDRDADRAVRLMTEHIREIEADLDLDRTRRAPVSLAEALRR